MVGNRNAHCDLVNCNVDGMIGKQNAFLIKRNADIIVVKQNGGNVKVKWNADIMEGIRMLALWVCIM